MATKAKTPKRLPRSRGNARTPTPPVRPYRRRLSSLRNVRNALADVARGLEAGERKPLDAKVLVYGYATLAGVIEKDREQTELAARVAALEQAVARRATRRQPLSPPPTPLRPVPPPGSSQGQEGSPAA